MSTGPRTEAGKALLKEWESDPYLINRVGSSVADRILAIEAERSTGAAPLDDERAVKTLTAHQQRDVGSCICGWMKWAASQSQAEHQWRMLKIAHTAAMRGIEAEAEAYEQWLRCMREMRDHLTEFGPDR